ncbi:DUF2867 domain-containing protein [Streptomyces sp. NPDC093089]|uniref:DUF2867 domain-containing protein n=1 Tax=Streptomyces sp. NPDC093089 TaxID=3366024 RepID=UPI00380BC202
MPRLPDAVHADRPWRIHEITRGFTLEDVWAVRIPDAGPDDLPTMLAAMQTAAGRTKEPLPTRFLFAVRWKLGGLFGWDTPASGTGAHGTLLRDHLPSDLGEATGGSDAGLAPLTSVYELDNECVLELATRTVHAVLHLGWVPTASGGHELRMAVLVKPTSLLGRLYMAAITPFRRLIVFPAFLRQWERAWRDHGHPGPQSADAADVDSVVGAHNIPESIRALSSLSHIDYADAFTLQTGEDASITPEQWARAMFGDVATAAEQLIWRGLLGLRLSRGRSHETVAGWQIAERGEDWIRLESASWFLTGNLLVQATQGRVTLGTFLRYDRRLGRAVWPPLSAIHRRLTPGLLRDAVAVVRAA